MLQEEVEEAAVKALVPAAVAAQPDFERARGHATCAAPHVGAAASCNGGCSTATCPRDLAAALPWHSRQLRRIFPSFKERHLHQGPMEVTHRDERGLLSMRALARLGLKRDSWSSPTPPPQQPPQQQQSQQQQVTQQQQQQQPRLQHLNGCSRGSSEQRGPPSRVLSVQQEEVVEEDLLSGQLGRSPDSEHSAEHTGRHLMESFSDLRGGSEEESSGRTDTQQYDGSSRSATAQAEPEALKACGQLHGAAPLPPVQHRPQQQQQQCSTLAAQAHAQHSPPPPQPASPPLSPRLPHQQSPRSPQHAQQVWERQSAASVQEAYSQPEHAQVAALLGQPVYDPSLASSTALVVPSTSMPYRSPFMSELLHHSHPPGPQEGPRSSTGCSPALSAADGGEAHPSGRLVGSSSIEAQWVGDDEEEEQLLEWEGFAASGSSAGSIIAAALGALPFSVRNAPLLRVIPKYYGIHQHSDGRTLLELEDLARAYRHPCIMDIKIGFRTWYPTADAKYIQRCKQKDKVTTQAALGFKICGMQVFRHGAGGYWRASKRWCKTLPVELVDKALLSFAHNEYGLRPSCVYGGEGGAIAQLEALEAWFSLQRDVHFYSSSVLVLYEGGAATPEDAKVRVRLVDFAHTFWQDGGAGQRRRDTNFLAGLRALLARLRSVVHAQLQADLT